MGSESCQCKYSGEWHPNWYFSVLKLMLPLMFKLIFFHQDINGMFSNCIDLFAGRVIDFFFYSPWVPKLVVLTFFHGSIFETFIFMSTSLISSSKVLMESPLILEYISTEMSLGFHRISILIDKIFLNSVFQTFLSGCWNSWNSLTTG